VLQNYLKKYDQVPWADLRYLYGEIMYGGHITDNWDRRTCATYLLKLVIPELMQRDFSLGPNFKSPEPHKCEYKTYRNYIEEKLPDESPPIFGMHANAEIGYLTQQSETIFATILDVTGAASKGAGAGSGADEVKNKIMDFKKKIENRTFNLLIIRSLKKEEDISPYDVVALQECERMNGLLEEIDKSLEELKQGLEGALNMTDAMDDLAKALTINRVPANWHEVAYPSKKPLALWFGDMLERVDQLDKWKENLVVPKSLWIAGLFNPMSFLTAIMQITARKKNLALDDMVLQTNFTAYKKPDEISAPIEEGEGYFCHGFYLEGASWDMGTSGSDGYIKTAILKELFFPMPVIHVVSVNKKERKIKGQYECPCYVTT
jgi:dynein heavy chain